MRSHSVTCHPAEVTFPPLPQPKLVLDLATPEGCKAELTWVVVISPMIVYPRNTVTYLSNVSSIRVLGRVPCRAFEYSVEYFTEYSSTRSSTLSYRVLEYSVQYLIEYSSMTVLAYAVSKLNYHAVYRCRCSPRTG